MATTDLTFEPVPSTPLWRVSATLLFVAASGWPVFAWLSGLRVTESGMIVAVAGMIALGIVFVAASIVANILEARELGRLQALFGEVQENNRQARELAESVLDDGERPAGGTPRRRIKLAD